MDRRSWPWKRKSVEKAIIHESAESSPVHSSRYSDDQVIAKILADNVHASGDAHLQWQLAEEKIKHLNKKLSSALLDVMAKKELINQHVKVAEEAVSGWEKAEKEAASLKQQLDVAFQQKLATEDRVSHLDAALKECMRQLRCAREEQEEKIHEAIIKKTRDWESKRLELKEKLADAEEKYLESSAESKAMAKLLQDRAIKISETSEAYLQVQSELNRLQPHLDLMEKQNMALKYELSMLRKEMEIRNQESILSKKTSEAANKRHLEEMKKVAKLEAECQRLRGLLRKKLPSPGLLAQIKMEVDSPAKDKTESAGKRGGKCSGSTLSKSRESVCSSSQGESAIPGKEVSILTERLSALEEETQRLKELLERKEKDLLLSRLTSANISNEVWSSEEQLDPLGFRRTTSLTAFDVHTKAEQMSQITSCEAKAISVSDDGEASCAESWASALIAELDNFRKDKPFPTAPKVVEDVASLQYSDSTFESATLDLQEKPDLNFTAQDDGRNIEAVLHQIRVSMEMQRQGNISEEEASSLSSDADFKLFALGPELTSTTCKLVQLIEDLSMAISIPYYHEKLSHDSGNSIKNYHASRMSRACCRDSELDPKVQTFIASSNRFLHGKVDIVLFISELSLVLSHLTDVVLVKNRASSQSNWDISSYAGSNVCSLISEISKSDDSDKELINGDGHDCSLHICMPEKVLNIEEELRRVRAEKVAFETHMKMEFERLSGIENEAAQLKKESMELEKQLHVTNERLSGIENEAAQLKKENMELEKELHMTNEECQCLRKQCNEMEQMVFDLQAELSTAKFSKQLAEEEHSKFALSRTELEGQLEATQIDLGELHCQLENLQKKLVQEHEKNAMLESKCQGLEEQLCKPVTILESQGVCMYCGRANVGVEQTSKEQELAIAASKLVECQKTILLLDKQLKAITSCKEPNNGNLYAVPYPKSADEATSVWQMIPSAAEANDEPWMSSGHVHPPQKKGQRYIRVKQEMAWDPYRDSNASDALEAELAHLSKSGKPLLELFGEKTPLHEDYIQALQEMPSSSSEEADTEARASPIIPKASGSPSAQVPSSRPTLTKKKGHTSTKTGVQLSTSTDDSTVANPTPSEKHGSFAKLFFSAKTKLVPS